MMIAVLLFLMAQDADVISSPRIKNELSIEGRMAQIPDGGVVVIRVWKVSQTAQWNDVKIRSDRMEGLPSMKVRVQGGKFRETFPLASPGSYVSQIEFTKDIQNSTRICRDFQSGKLSPLVMEKAFDFKDASELAESIKAALPQLIRTQNELLDLQERLSAAGADVLAVSVRCGAIKEALGNQATLSPLSASVKALESLANTIQHEADLSAGNNGNPPLGNPALGGSGGVNEEAKDLIQRQQPAMPGAPKGIPSAKSPKNDERPAKEGRVDKITRLAARETSLAFVMRAKALVEEASISLREERIAWARAQLGQMTRIEKEWAGDESKFGGALKQVTLRSDEFYALGLEILSATAQDRQELLRKFNDLGAQLETALRETP